MHQKSDFTGGPFDFSFTSFVTARIIRVLYILFYFFSGIGAIIIFAKSGRTMDGGISSALVRFLSASLFFVVFLLLARIFCEMLIVIFRIAEHTANIAASLEASNAGLKPVKSYAADPVQLATQHSGEAQTAGRISQSEKKCSCGAAVPRSSRFCTECGKEF
jgi:hypothetical protein